MSLVPWQQQVVECLRELSDIDLQKRAWLEGMYELCPDPVELLCQIFDDTGVLAELDARQAFSPKCDALLRKLHRMTNEVDVERPPECLLEDPKWKEVTSMAKIALDEITKLSDSVQS